MTTRVHGTVIATVIQHDPGWQEPVIPIVAGITGWSEVEDDGFTRWFPRAGEVVLGMWSDDNSESGRSADEIVIAEAAQFEVILSLHDHAAILASLLEAGQGTLAVLEFRGGEDEPPQWGTREIEIEGLAEAIARADQLAGIASGRSCMTTRSEAPVETTATN